MKGGTNTEEFAQQQKVKYFGNLLCQLEEHHLTHIYRGVFLFGKYEGIRYLVLKYLNTSTLRFKEFSEDWLLDDEV